MLKLCKTPLATFRVIWSVGRYGLIVSNEPNDERWLIHWAQALEMTNDAARSAEAVEKRMTVKSAGQPRRKATVA